MFYYYGAKGRFVKLYPKPIYEKIIEPFAGSAKYSLEYYDKNITIIDKYTTIIEIWKYLQYASKKDILNLPQVKPGSDLRLFKQLSEVERNFMSFLCGGGSKPQMKISSFNNTQKVVNNKKIKIANNLYKIKHWNIILGSYEHINIKEKCTWFIDPPYQFGGIFYPEHNIDYKKLNIWCKQREGQIIVCENTKCNWITIEPLYKLKLQHNATIEGIYYNET